jgi:hypothetical protein
MQKEGMMDIHAYTCTSNELGRSEQVTPPRFYRHNLGILVQPEAMSTSIHQPWKLWRMSGCAYFPVSGCQYAEASNLRRLSVKYHSVSTLPSALRERR